MTPGQPISVALIRLQLPSSKKRRIRLNTSISGALLRLWFSTSKRLDFREADISRKRP
jgi:hypothetical protein